MKEEQAKVFLSKIKERIKDGEYDAYVKPFVSRDLIYASFKARILKKLDTGATPILSESEIKDALQDAKDIGVITYALFLEAGIIKKEENNVSVQTKLLL